MGVQAVEDKAVSPSPPSKASGARDRRPWPEIEAELAAGLRNHWYGVLPSDELPAGKPLGLRRMGEDIALWRDETGAVRVFADWCPHRGAKLSMGMLQEGGIRCRYHGWKFDVNGQCQEIPSEGTECRMTAEVKVTTYPAEEHGGLIFVYFSSDGRAPHEPCPNPYELESPDWNGFIVRHHWKDVPWFRALDNLVDPLHAPFLHAGTYTLHKTNSYQDVIDVRTNPDGSHHVSRKGQSLVNFDYVEYHFPNWFRLDIPYPRSAGPGGPMRILIMVCPIDESSCQVYMVRKRNITGWKWWLWKVLWHVRLERKMWQVIDQDEAILLSQRHRASLNREYLVQGDRGVIVMRNQFREAIAKDKSGG